MSNRTTHILCLLFLILVSWCPRDSRLRDILHLFGDSLFLSLMPREATPHIIRVLVDQAEGEAQGQRDAADTSQPGVGRTRLQAHYQQKERDGDKSHI